MTASAAKPRTGTAKPRPLAKAAGKAAKTQAPKKERPAAKSQADQLREAEASYIKKYPKRQIQPGSIRQESDGAHAGKRTVVIICENAQCGKKRRVATSDLHQVRHCQDCTEQIRAARRRKGRPARPAGQAGTKKAAAKAKPTNSGAKAKPTKAPVAKTKPQKAQKPDTSPNDVADAGTQEPEINIGTMAQDVGQVPDGTPAGEGTETGGTTVVETHTVREETHTKEVHTEQPAGQPAAQPAAVPAANQAGAQAGAQAGGFAGTLDDRLKNID